MTTTDVTRANRLELEVLTLRAENEQLRRELAALMEPFDDGVPQFRRLYLNTPKRNGRTEFPSTIPLGSEPPNGPWSNGPVDQGHGGEAPVVDFEASAKAGFTVYDTHRPAGA